MKNGEQAERRANLVGDLDLVDRLAERLIIAEPMFIDRTEEERQKIIVRAYEAAIQIGNYSLSLRRTCLVDAGFDPER